MILNITARLLGQLIDRLLEIIAPHGLGVAENGLLPDEELDGALEALYMERVTDLLSEGGWYCYSLLVELELEELILKLNRLVPTRFIRRRLAPTCLRIPAPRIEVLQPLVGRGPPPVAFIPIPHKTEQGSCARSDLADSAY
ncbi:MULTISPECIES: hypothetical protein [unclassified Microcoleus]|uniref:hypothetical protein n=1 Tax=unclassified Microcoleus TaxID=2642155 RepID=UPI002FD1D3BE